MNKERRNQIKQVVLNALRYSNSNTLPVPIEKIAKSYKSILLIAYSEYMKKYDLSYDDMISLTKTKDACTDYCICKKKRALSYEDMIKFTETNDDSTDYYVTVYKYVIYYNDLDLFINASDRYRWNIAHELGHVLLNHHVNNDKTRIFRNSLTDNEYNELEGEADYFASLLLVPYAPLTAFILNRDLLQAYCRISKAAAGRRLYEYNIWKKNLTVADNYDKPLFEHYYEFSYKRKCTNCNAKLIQRKGKYCPICGEQTLIWGDGKMVYNGGLKLNGDEKIIHCPVCDNAEISDDGSYCNICGLILINRCSNYDDFNSYPDECGQPASGKDRYCIYCGSPTLFYQKKILKDWWVEANKPNPNILDRPVIGDGFMNIPDGIDEELPFN